MQSNLELAQKLVESPSAEGLRAWQVRMHLKLDGAAEALGISRAAYANMVSIKEKDKAKRLRIDRRTALACLAIEMGLSPFPLTQVPPMKRGPKPKVKVEDPQQIAGNGAACNE